MSERPNAITMKGSPLTLIGNEIKIGERAPEFTVLDTDLNEVSLSEYLGKKIIIASVPSLDTSVCSTETKRFSDEIKKLGDDVILLTISMDLPFAQKRWMDENSVENVVALSDHRDASFGKAYGLLIKELRLLARNVIIIDTNGIIQYAQLVKEVTDEPDYDEVIAKVNNI